MLEVKNITVYYDQVQALEDVSFNINKGEIVSIIGPNGAGKSTALKAICGLVKLKSGNIILKNENISNIKPYNLINKGISYVPEKNTLFKDMAVYENLEMGGFTIKENKILKNKIEDIFELFPILKARKKQIAGTMSGGEQQMLVLAMAMLLQPELLIIDEPSVGLAPKYVEQVFEKIQQINKSGTSILIVEQNVNLVLKNSHRGYVLNLGKVEIEDKADKLINSVRLKKVFLE